MKRRRARGAVTFSSLLLGFACTAARVPTEPATLAASRSGGTTPDTAQSASASTTEAQQPRSSRSASIAQAADPLPDQLAAPAELFLAHEQVAPPGFRGPSGAPWVHAKMFAFGFADPAFGTCDERVLNRDGTICTGAAYPGAELTHEQSERVATLGQGAQKSSREREQLRCFEPHHAVVFYDAHEVPVSEVTVCFECGNLRVSPGSSEPSTLSAVELRYFAELCRSRHVGGCPTVRDGNEVRAAEFVQPELPAEKLQAWRVHRALERDHGLPATERLDALTARERLRLCAWLESASRFTGRRLACRDGRHFDARGIDECSATKATHCAATVGDFTRCSKSRFDPLCGQDSPSCAASDACQWGLLQSNSERGQVAPATR